MWLPLTRQRVVENRLSFDGTHFRPPSEEEIIRRNVDWLISHQYEPDAERGATTAMFEEPVNPGDLRCTEVRAFKDGGWQVVLEEAAPGACPKLCAYIAGWLDRWGWPNVEVLTEW